MAQTTREPLTVVTAAVPREHREALEELAAREDRTVSYLVRCAVRDYLHAGVMASAAGVEAGAEGGPRR